MAYCSTFSNASIKPLLLGTACVFALSACGTDGSENAANLPQSPAFVEAEPVNVESAKVEPVNVPSGESLQLIGELHEPVAERTSQVVLMQTVAQESYEDAFNEIFELGDELFDTDFSTLDGGGANIGNGMRYTRVPRADLKGENQWANHTPYRHTGPNAQSCTACHNQPFEDGAGNAAMNVIRDPTESGQVDKFIVRNTPHLFGIGGLQRLAEEMTDDLHRIEADALAQAKDSNGAVTERLITKNVDFGQITAAPSGDVDYTGIEGVSDDLVIKPLQWKGSDATIRKFTRDAAHRELGVQAVELVGKDVDGDFDGVVNEMTVGDVTAMAIYTAGQPRPTTKLELAELGLIDALEQSEVDAIAQGGEVFEVAGCASCHLPEMTLKDPVFSEPSQHAPFRDEVFPNGQDPIVAGVNPARPIVFDLTKDLPDNRLEMADGSTHNFGNFEEDGQGGAIVRLFSDLKRHDLGSEIAENIDEEKTGASVFMTAELWGVGDTAPYLHDGRALTLTEAILAHGGDAKSSSIAFQGLDRGEQKALIAFLDNLVLFKTEEEEHEEDEDHDADVAALQK